MVTSDRNEEYVASRSLKVVLSAVQSVIPWEQTIYKKI